MVNSDHRAREQQPSRKGLTLAPPARLPRRGFLRGAVGVTAGGALACAHTPAALALATTVAPRSRPGQESLRDILDVALVAERVAATFYYTGLTTLSIVSAAASNSHAPGVGAGGAPITIAALRAALSQEQAHARLLAQRGARAASHAFYFPASTFEELGYTSRAGTFLWVLDHLETAVIGLYLAAIARCGVLGRPDVAVLAARILGVECEHRALSRMVSRDDPADNVTLEVANFATVSAALKAFQPFLTGVGFPGGSSHPLALPSAVQVAWIVNPKTGR